MSETPDSWDTPDYTVTYSYASLCWEVYAVDGEFIGAVEEREDIPELIAHWKKSLTPSP